MGEASEAVGSLLKSIATSGSACSSAAAALIVFTNEEGRSRLVHGLFIEHLRCCDGNGAIRHGGRRGEPRPDYAFFVRPGFYFQGFGQHVKPVVRSIENSDGVLIFDDTIQEKAWTDENELMCWHYDHVSARNVRGINLLNALYHSNGTSIPVAFELVKKPIQYCDLETRQLKRRSEVTKNELMREMIDTCIRNELKFRFVLMDSWFSATENFDFITGKASRLLLSVLHNALEASVLR